jgi:hypothetical protein
LRGFSRVLELDPLSLDIIWEYTAREAGFRMPMYEHRFYSSLVSSAQRLPNGNTLITEGVDGRIFEITRDNEIVWEYVNPICLKELTSLVYRAYKVPYEWAPCERTKETAVHRLDNSNFRVPDSNHARTLRITDTATEVSETAPSFACYPLPPNLDLKAVLVPPLILPARKR